MSSPAPVPVMTIQTTPFHDQKPGTSGLRKPVATFQKEHYCQNFIQACLLAGLEKNLEGSSVLIGGDGRFFCKEAAQMIIQMAAANRVGKIVIGQNSILSTPACSHIIIHRKLNGGFLLTASHNPGGPNGDFGIKYNIDNGGPAPETVTNKIYELTKTIKEYKIIPDLKVNIDNPGTSVHTISGHKFIVEVIDSISDYVELMKSVFDFQALKSFLQNKKILLNAMHGVTGPYLRKIFVGELGLSPDSCLNCDILPDFGGKHPDPNLTYAKDLVDIMKKGEHDFAAAFDGDGDRNMILGHKAFFVNPSDSLAVLAANLKHVPYFKDRGISGVARSMPTSQAVDLVAWMQSQNCYVTPTGWKYFGSLMDSGRIQLCGEESFGTGTDIIREKDGVWTALAWLSVMAGRQKSVKEILMDHWQTYGRNFFARYDYENVSSEAGEKVMSGLMEMVDNPRTLGMTLPAPTGELFKINLLDNFEYTDPVDGTITKNQGIRFHLNKGSRIIYRLSGTGSSGATIRIYIETYKKSSNPTFYEQDVQEVLRPLISLALEISNLEAITGRKEPTVIT